MFWIVYTDYETLKWNKKFDHDSIILFSLYNGHVLLFHPIGIFQQIWIFSCYHLDLRIQILLMANYITLYFGVHILVCLMDTWLLSSLI